MLYPTPEEPLSTWLRGPCRLCGLLRAECRAEPPNVQDDPAYWDEAVDDFDQIPIGLRDGFGPTDEETMWRSFEAAEERRYLTFYNYDPVPVPAFDALAHTRFDAGLPTPDESDWGLDLDEVTTDLDDPRTASSMRHDPGMRPEDRRRQALDGATWTPAPPTPPRPRAETGSWCVYVMWSHGRTCLYVGQSIRLPDRLKAHSKDKPWWTEVAAVEVWHQASFSAMVEAEARLIRDLKPQYNVREPRTVLPSPKETPCPQT